MPIVLHVAIVKSPEPESCSCYANLLFSFVWVSTSVTAAYHQICVALTHADSAAETCSFHMRILCLQLLYGHKVHPLKAEWDLRVACKGLA